MKILVVDDDATNRLVIKGLLVRESHEILMASDGAEAIDVFHQNKPDLILMDVMMPVMDGYEATRRIKAECQDDFVPIIFLTAMSGEEALVACLENGGDDYLNKPINRKVLNAKINAMRRIRNLHNTVILQRQILAEQQRQNKQDHDTAEHIFSNIMGKGDLAIPIIKTYRQSADTFNGDIVLAAKSPEGGVNLLVGDFTGHGLAAGIGALPVSDTFYAMTAKGFPLEDIVSEINKKLRMLLPSGRFLAAIMVNINLQCTRLTVWSGGMPDLLVLDRQGKVIQRLESFHVPLSVFSPVAFDSDTRTLEIEPGDRVFIYSDGVTEATNPDEEMFGCERLEHILTTTGDADNVLESLIPALDEFRAGHPQSDDITAVQLSCNAQYLFDSLVLSDNSGTHRMATQWELELRLCSGTLRRFDPVTYVLRSLFEIQGIQTHSERLFLVLSELFNNALEHGLLKLDSSLKAEPEGFSAYYFERQRRLDALTDGHIDIKLSHEAHGRGGKLTIQMMDSGEGFAMKTSESKQEETMSPSGRGIALVRSICSELTFSERGNWVTAVYLWNEL